MTPLITFETFVHPGTEWLGIEFNIVALRKFSTSLHKFGVERAEFSNEILLRFIGEARGAGFISYATHG